MCSSRPRFVADEMVGRLAKWLRLLGYDTTYAGGCADTDILELAEREGRIILTRDTELVRRKRCRNYIFIETDHWREQLRQVYREARLDCERMLSLCVVCNHVIDTVNKESIETLVPPYVYQTQEYFRRCDTCGRIFWAATHVGEIRKELEAL